MSSAAPEAQPKGEREEFAAFVTDGDTAAMLAPLVEELGWSPERVQTGGIAGAVRSLSVMDSPEFLVVDLSGSDDPRGDIYALSEVCEPGTVVVAIGDTNDVTLYRDLLTSGVHDYLLKPVTADLMRDALASAQSILNEPAPEASDDAQAATHQICAIVGIRGGVGSSLLTTGIAWHIAHKLKRSTAILDMDLHFGTSALAFDLEPGRGLQDALENPSRVDNLFIERALIRESENLAILGAESPLAEPLQPDPAAVTHLASELKHSFESVIMDLPRAVSTDTPYLLRELDKIAIVNDLSLSSTRDCIRYLGFLSNMAPDTEVKIIVNKTGKGGVEEVALKDFEASIERKADWVLPMDAKATAEASKRGKPVTAVAPNSKISKYMAEIASDFTGVTPPKKKGWSLLGGGKDKKKKKK